MAPQSSSSSSSGFEFDVFLSFRGVDTRYGFTGNLYKALKDKGIRTFIDDRELKGGEEITPSLLKAIQDSKIAIIVFSENYAESSFCLDELVHILECSKTKDQLVLPIFYNVEPTHVRHHSGSYGKAIANHEKKFQNNNIHNMEERLQKWKMALKQVADFSGYAFNLDRKEYEYEFIEKIIVLISEKINHTLLHVPDCRVGLEPRVLQVKSLLNVESVGLCMVGIHGMGGIGKTTLVKEVYNTIASQFEASCFLDDVRQNTLQNLQERLIYETIKERDIKLGSVSKGILVIKQRLHTKKVLLILDDVDDLNQLEALVGGSDWYGPGSQVIITTRDLSILKSHGIVKTYKVEELNKDEALELLSWKAFRNNIVDPSYKDILNEALTYASGLPLALEVVGSNLFGKGIEKWEPTLTQYKRNPHKNIQKILRVSFDALEKDEQSVFLDIACCFKFSELKDVEHILCAHYGHCIKYLIEVLVEKSLIKIAQGDYVTLHDLIEEMGKEIVRQESPKEPTERSRLWFHKDIITVFDENTGTSKTEIIYLDCRLVDSVLEWNRKAFKNMKNLKTLIIKCGYGCNFSKDFQHFPSSLRVLEVKGHPTSKFIPSIFFSKKFENMKILKFDSNGYLTNIPNVSGLPNLEIFSFRYCINLITIHESVGFLSKLKILDVEYCIKLKSFPPIIKLPFLEELRLLRCESLDNFPEISGEMKHVAELFLMKTSIKKLPTSFENLTGLCKLTIEGVRLPISILNMTKLSEIIAINCRLLPIVQNDSLSFVKSSNVKFLHLQNCKLTDEILSIVVKLVSNVEELYLEGSNFTTIPECIKECHFLWKLSLDDCKYLQEIRGIPPNLKYFSALGCELLTSFSCESLLMDQKLHENGGTEFCFPRRTEMIPEWFEHQKNMMSFHVSISFWFRKSLPSISVFFHCRTLVGRERFLGDFNGYMSIHDCKYPLRIAQSGHKSYAFSEMKPDYIYLLDVRMQDRGLESKLEEVLLKNEWIHSSVQFERVDVEWIDYFQWETNYHYLIESGIHVFQEKTSMDDIRFTYPYDT